MRKFDAYKNVQKYIKEHGRKQNYLAEQLDITPVEMSRLLTGRTKLTADEIINLSLVLDSDPNELLGYKELIEGNVL